MAVKKRTKKASKKKTKASRAVKKKAAKRTTKILLVMPQSGFRKSIKADRKRKALLPGRRISKTGRKYTETRRNRSDRKGSLL